ncbi:hypothetical protein ACFQJ8_27330 [Halocatena marina]|uniref:hypothetical protein n=1 Tax=Halocatena marina TaxID=2934937 RepID=UPI003612DB7C
MLGGSPRELPTFPNIEAEIGYHPARFLDRSATSQDSIGDTSELALARATIRGIDDIETIRAWIEVEVFLGRNDGSPRQQVIAWLNQRQAALQNTGTQQTEKSTETPEAPTETEDSATVDTETNGNDAVLELTPTAATTTSASTVATDGGGPPSTPRCPEPDCHAKLVREDVGDKTAFWCSFCGSFKEPLTQETGEAVA